MDQRHYTRDYEPEEQAAGNAGSSDDFIDIDRLLSIVSRRLWLIAGCVVLALAIGVAYLAVAPRTYTAQTSILLDNNLAKYATDQAPPARQDAQTDTDVSSEIEILNSQQMATTVVDKLNLDKNADFMNPPTSPVAWLKGTVKSIVAALLPHPAPKSSSSGGGSDAGGDATTTAQDAAAALLRQSLDVSRSGRSMVINVAFTAYEPELAKRITRAYADAYLSDQLNANFDATKRATVWLQQRLGDLKDSARKASMDVARYKANNGLTQARGQLVSEQQLSDINTQLINAQADLASAAARYHQYEAIVAEGPKEAVKNATVSSSDSTTDSTVLAKLRSQYLNVSNRADSVAARFGKDHPQVTSLRNQQQELADQIYQELKQLTTSYKNQYDVAKSRVDSLRKSISQLTGETSDANKSLVRLNTLQQRADALNKLYQDYLSRYEEATQQSTFPIAKARVISEAGLPTAPSSPSKKLVLGLSIVLGLMAGGGLATLAEFRERSFRTERDVQSALDLKFLGYLPELSAEVQDGRDRPKRSTAEVESLFPPAMRIAVDRPSSAYAETLRTVKLAADIVLDGRDCKVIGIISALPQDGKTTVAANLAGLLAATGFKTLLIDGDLRKPGLSRQISEPVTSGLVEAVTGGDSWTKSVKIDKRSRLAVLPSVGRHSLQHSSEFLTTRGMAKLMQSTRDMFDYVIIDLPPSQAVIDARAIEPLTDAFVAVARWGETPKALLRGVIDADRRVRTKVLGVVLNRTDMKKLPSYATIDGSERFIDRYAAYYDTDG